MLDRNSTPPRRTPYPARRQIFQDGALTWHGHPDGCARRAASRLLLGTVILLPAVTLILLGVRLLEQDRALAAQRRTELAQSAADRAVRALELEISAVTRRIGDPAWHIDAPEPGTMHVVVSTAGLRVEPVAAVAWYPDRPPLPEPPAAASAKAEAAEFQAADLAAALALNRRLAVFRAASAGGDVAPDVH